MERVLRGDGRLVIGDAVSDRLAARLVDFVNRRVDRAHVRMYRVRELAGFLEEAGLDGIAARRLVGGGYAIVRARKPS
jgi:hypothetical protein